MARPLRWDRIETRARYLIRVAEDKRFLNLIGFEPKHIEPFREMLLNVADVAHEQQAAQEAAEALVQQRRNAG